MSSSSPQNVGVNPETLDAIEIKIQLLMEKIEKAAKALEEASPTIDRIAEFLRLHSYPHIELEPLKLSAALKKFIIRDIDASFENNISRVPARITARDICTQFLSTLPAKPNLFPGYPDERNRIKYEMDSLLRIFAWSIEHFVLPIEIAPLYKHINADRAKMGLSPIDPNSSLASVLAGEQKIDLASIYGFSHLVRFLFKFTRIMVPESSADDPVPWIFHANYVIVAEALAKYLHENMAKYFDAELDYERIE